jgi:hypothetical protein
VLSAGHVLLKEFKVVVSTGRSKPKAVKFKKNVLVGLDGKSCESLPPMANESTFPAGFYCQTSSLVLADDSDGETGGSDAAAEDE